MKRGAYLDMCVISVVARPLAHGRTCIFTLRAFVKSEHRDALG